jgi:N-carbamoyl-L-amino-acid hydrolase
MGSRLMSGSLEAERADGLKDSEGGQLAEVRKQAGFTGAIDSVRLKPGAYHAWIELHIEQGPLLEREGLSLGIVTSIAAPASYRFTISGIGGHAGALLMPDRRDALCAASELVLSIERHALETGAIDTVATVGTCEVHPGAINSVPSRVVLQLDIRDTQPERRESVMCAVRRDIEDIQGRRGVAVDEQMINADKPATCDPHIIAVLEDICKENEVAYKTMVSRAYHDSLFMAQLAPAAMVFIPCRGGVSHRPDEFAEPGHIALGVSVLAEALAKLASE